VKLLAVMGGKYPSSAGEGCECNFCAIYNDGGQDHKVGSAAASFVFANMPPEVKILYSGFDVGVQVHSGGALTECAPTSNPCRAAYISYCEHIPGASFAAILHPKSFVPGRSRIAGTDCWKSFVPGRLFLEQIAGRRRRVYEGREGRWTKPFQLGPAHHAGGGTRSLRRRQRRPRVHRL
jgi:hypothetical protein